MRILNATLVILLMFLSKSFCVDLECLYRPHQWETCVVANLVITSPDETITSVNGDTDPYTSPDSCESLIIRNQKVSFVPRNIAVFFPKLLQLEISNSSLERIEQADIRELTSLRTLNLNSNNLEILEEGLFDFNILLETINISGNRLKLVYKNVFYALSTLESIDLDENPCTTFFDDGDKCLFKTPSSYKDNVVDQLNQNCQSLTDVKTNYKNKELHEKIADLQKEIIKLTHKLTTCDGNLVAALANLRNQKLVNTNRVPTDRLDKSLEINLDCDEDQCVAVEFKVTFANSSIGNLNHETKKIALLKIHQQQTLFLPHNLAEHFPLLNDLSVTECDLFEIGYDVFGGLSELVSLNLSNNKIFEIPVDTFTDMKMLLILDLSFNKILTLQDGVLASQTNVQKLLLNNNQLTSITFGVLQNLINLSGLFLQNNQLKFISATLLAPFTSLESVDFSGNSCINMSHPTSSLMDIETTIIDNCIAPVDLYCGNGRDGNYSFCSAKDLVIEYPKTKISKLHAEASDELNALETLNDSVKIFFAKEQSIKFFPYQLSKHFPNLQRIEIQASKLTSLHQFDFVGFSKLTEIVMNNNNLSSINESAFDTIPELQLLDLSSNGITSLPTRIFAKLIRLHTLLLSNNRIVRFNANVLPRKNVIDVFRIDNNQLEFIETIRFLRKAQLIDLTENVCIDMKFAKNENSTRALVELSGEIDLNCSLDDYYSR